MLAPLLLCVALVGQAGEPRPSGADSAAEERLRAATEALDALRLEEAASLLEQLVADPNVPDAIRGEAWLSLGLTRASLLDDTGARTAFAAALAIDPRLAPTAGTSPKVRALFDDTRTALLPNGVPPPRKATPDDEPATERPQVVAPPPTPPASTRRSPPPPRTAESSSAPWLIGGGVLVGTATLAGGAALLADASLADPAPLRTRAEYETTRSLGIAAFASSIVLATAGVMVLAGSLSADEGAPP